MSLRVLSFWVISFRVMSFRVMSFRVMFLLGLHKNTFCFACVNNFCSACINVVAQRTHNDAFANSSARVAPQISFDSNVFLGDEFLHDEFPGDEFSCDVVCLACIINV